MVEYIINSIGPKPRRKEFLPFALAQNFMDTCYQIFCEAHGIDPLDGKEDLRKQAEDHARQVFLSYIKCMEDETNLEIMWYEEEEENEEEQ